MMNVDFLRWLADSSRLKRLLPASFKMAFLKYLPYDRYMRHVWAREAPFPNIDDQSADGSHAKVKMGIIHSHHYWHRYYTAACIELGIPYCTFDIERSDWLDEIRNSGCHAFLAWPSASLGVWKQMYDERLAILAGPLGSTVFPPVHSLWIYESKRRMHYWLAAEGFPQPQTWIFYNRDEAMQFAAQAELPIVTKTDLGAVSSGVRIVRTRSQLHRLVLKAFGSGILRSGADRRDRQWSHIIFQRFIPQAREWRMIRIGKSYFGYEKLRVGDFHSGTEQWNYIRPPDNLLNLARQVTARGDFPSMSIDILLDEAGNVFITELQAVFGMLNDYACRVDGHIGRMLYDESACEWRFEKGDFCRNRMCNLRVQTVLEMLGCHSMREEG